MSQWIKGEKGESGKQGEKGAYEIIVIDRPFAMKECNSIKLNVCIWKVTWASEAKLAQPAAKVFEANAVKLDCRVNEWIEMAGTFSVRNIFQLKHWSLQEWKATEGYQVSDLYSFNAVWSAAQSVSSFKNLKLRTKVYKGCREKEVPWVKKAAQVCFRQSIQLKFSTNERLSHFFANIIAGADGQSGRQGETGPRGSPGEFYGHPTDINQEFVLIHFQFVKVLTVELVLKVY